VKDIGCSGKVRTVFVPNGDGGAEGPNLLRNTLLQTAAVSSKY